MHVVTVAIISYIPCPNTVRNGRQQTEIVPMVGFTATLIKALPTDSGQQFPLRLTIYYSCSSMEWHRQVHAEEDHLLESAKFDALSAKMHGMFRSFGRRPRLEVPALEETSTRAYDL
jgi:hypothetical protein